MIQLNLLPDVKLEYIKTQRSKRVVILVASLITAAALAILIMLFVTVNVLQKRHLSNLDQDIQTEISALQSIPDLDRILTIQNQLEILPDLHEQKPAASRVTEYLTQLTPNEISISNVVVDFETETISITGEAPSLEVVNKYIDTIKFTEVSEDQSSAEELDNAFSEVVLTNFGRDQDGSNYQIDFRFNPVIFDNTKDIELVVPNIVSTRSETESPTELFQETENGPGAE